MSDLAAITMDKYSKHLASLSSSAARRAFIVDRIEFWEGHYESFRRKVDAGQPTGKGTAFDFVCIIEDLQKALAQYEREAA